MRHKISGKRMGRTSSHRKSLLRNLSIALIKHEQIKTTLPKAKFIRSFFEQLITLAKKAENLSNAGDAEGSLHKKRLILSALASSQDGICATRKLLDILAPRYSSRSGGYIRIVKCINRESDNAPMAIIELLDRDESSKGSQFFPKDPRAKFKDRNIIGQI